MKIPLTPLLPLLLLPLLTWAVPTTGGRPQGIPPGVQALIAQGGAGPPVSDCPKVPIVKNFQADKYLGRWFEIQRFEAPFQTGDCGTADYSLLKNCSISVTNTQVLPNGQVDQAKGLAHSAGDPTRGSLTVSFDNEPDNMGSREGNYNVLATDYANYAVVYSCSLANFGGRQVKLEFSWILARRPFLNQAFLTKLMGWLQRLGIDTSRYRVTRHQGCQYAAV